MSFPHRYAHGIASHPRPAPATTFRSKTPTVVFGGASPTHELRRLGRGQISLRNRALYNSLMALDHILPRKLAVRWIAGSRERVHVKIRNELEHRPKGTLVPVIRRRNLSPDEFFHEYLRPGIPVVMEGMASDWPCCGKWTFDFFDELYGDDPVVLTDGVVPHVPSVARRYAVFRDILRSSDGAQAEYLRFHPLLALHPELTDDFPLNWFETYKHRRSLYSHIQFFVGSKGTATGLHNSQLCNLFVMVHGEKQWVLYPTAYTPFMDPQTTRSVYRLSRHNTGNFIEPALSKLDGYLVHMRPGDVLWNPPFYWHSVRNMTDTIGVGYRWNDQRAAARQSLSMLLLDLFATDPTWFRIWRIGVQERRRMLRRGRNS